MERAELLEVLERLGVPIRAGELYVQIAEVGRKFVADLRSEFGGGRKDLLKDLKWLQDNGFVLVQFDPARHKEAIALAPSIVARSLYARFLWSYAPFEHALSRLSPKERLILERYRKLCQAMEELASEIYQPSDLSQTLVMYQPDESPNALAVTLREASQEILGITVPPWVPNISVIWETLKERIEKGVRYRRICDEVTFVSFGHSTNRRDVLEVGVRLRVITHERISDKFFLIDRNAVFVLWPKRRRGGFDLEATRLTAEAFVNKYRKTFELMWHTGISGRDLIAYMDTVRDSFLSRCQDAAGDMGERLGAALFDYGRFCRPQYVGLSAQSIAPILATLAQHSLLVPLSDAGLRFVPNLFGEVRTYITSHS